MNEWGAVTVTAFGVEVTLTAAGELRAAAVGYARRENAIRRRLVSKHRSVSGWAGDIEGACAELSGSLATGMPWTGEHVLGRMPKEKKPDLGSRTEVRWSMSRPPVLNYDLHDRDDWLYLLVSGYAPTFLVHGLILGAECRRDEWRFAYPERDVYRVPTSALRIPTLLRAGATTERTRENV